MILINSFFRFTNTELLPDEEDIFYDIDDIDNIQNNKTNKEYIDETIEFSTDGLEKNKYDRLLLKINEN